MATLIGAKVPVVYTLVQVDVMSCRYMQRIKWVLVTTTRSINRLTYLLTYFPHNVLGISVPRKTAASRWVCGLLSHLDNGQ